MTQKRLISFDVGIKNLAYCIFDIVDECSTIKQWDVLNLCEAQTTAICRELLKNKKTCGKQAKFKKESECVCDKHARMSLKFFLPQPCNSLSSLKKKSAEDIKILHQNLLLQSSNQSKKLDMIHEIVTYHANRSWEPIVVVKKNASTLDLITIGRSLHAQLSSQNEIMTTVTDVIIENQISPIANRMKTLQGMLAQHFISLGVSNIEFVSSGNKLKDFKEISEAKTPYQNHKKDAVIHCRTLLEEMGDDKWGAFFRDHPTKKDDLADCFLQGIWYLKKHKKQKK
jgi:hypothetical protein